MPKWERETDKAVAFKVQIKYEFNASSSLWHERTRTTLIWIPKSQLDKDGNPAEWIFKKSLDKAAHELSPFNTSYGWAYSANDSLKEQGISLFKTERELQWEKERLAKRQAKKEAQNALKLQKATTLKPIKPSSAITRDYAKLLQKVTKEINSSVSWWALANIGKNLDKNTSKQLSIEFNKLLKEWQSKLNKSAVVIARRLQKQLKGYVDINLSKQLENSPLKDSAKSALAITSAPVKQSLVSSYEANLALIKSIPADIIARYKQGFLQGIANFDRESLLNVAKQYEGISLRRAKLIARDQVAKGIANYQTARAQDLGFAYYMWVTSHDERVSKGDGGHIYLDGRIYRYDEPSAIIDSYKNKGHPAQRVNCRCSQISIMPEPTQELKKIKDGEHGDYYEIVKKM